MSAHQSAAMLCQRLRSSGDALSSSHLRDAFLMDTNPFLSKGTIGWMPGTVDL